MSNTETAAKITPEDLGNKLQAAIRLEDDLLRLHRQLADRLHENSLQGRQTVVALDDLDQVGPDLLNLVQRLLRTDAAHAGWLTIIASANTSQLGRLGKGLLELADLRIDLEPWDELDTIGYLQLAQFEAGAERPLFDDQAMTELHRASGGVPRRVNRLAEFALLAGAEHSQEIIDAAAIESAGAAINLSLPD